MAVLCRKCKTENDDHCLRCGKCGNSLSKRGDYQQSSGPNVVVLGSVEDLRRAREMGDIDTSQDDATALGWLESGEVDEAPFPPTSLSPQTRRVNVREIDKISGLRDLRDLQAALLKEEATPTPAPAVAERRVPPTESRKAARDPDEPPRAVAPPTREVPAPGEPEGDAAPAGPPLAYLANELFPDPIPLTQGRRYLMGRDPRASIFLPSAHVSRRHAGIAADAQGEFWVEDLRSSNGTYVNGRAVLRRKLRPGDLVDVGPFSFRFVPVKAGEPAPSAGSDPNEETRAIRSVPGSLSGEIEKNGVIPVLLLICSAQRSGVLTLRAGPHVGRIFVIEGEVHHAQFGKAAGEAALAALLPAEGGFLHFSDERIRVNRTITRTTAEIFGGP